VKWSAASQKTKPTTPACIPSSCGATRFARAKKAGEIRSSISVVPLRMFVLGALNWTVEWIDADHLLSMR